MPENDPRVDWMREQIRRVGWDAKALEAAAERLYSQAFRTRALSRVCELGIPAEHAIPIAIPIAIAAYDSHVAKQRARR
ncbi:MAG: hypothetical protein WC700_18575 [Gemmatimonadaceae bacterium]